MLSACTNQTMLAQSQQVRFELADIQHCCKTMHNHICLGNMQQRPHHVQEVDDVTGPLF